MELKFWNEEIKVFKVRFGWFESEKKDLEDELRFVKVKVNCMEKDIKELSEVKMV